MSCPREVSIGGTDVGGPRETSGSLGGVVTFPVGLATEGGKEAMMCIVQYSRQKKTSVESTKDDRYTDYILGVRCTEIRGLFIEDHVQQIGQKGIFGNGVPA